MVLVKNRLFSFFLLGNKGEENVFYYILERKKAFLGYKNTKFKKFKIWDLSMVLVKIGHFSTLSFLINLGKEKEFYDLLKRKNAFLGYKNKKFKKWKNWCFSKGVSSLFWSKSGYFCMFFFSREFRPWKCGLLSF